MKRILLLATTMFVGASVANADVNVTPLVGYQFQTTNTLNKQEDVLGVGQKNHATYGLQVTQDIGKNQVGVEYLRTDSNLDSYQVGVVGSREIFSNVYATGGAGYTKVEGPRSNIESPFVNLGLGVKVPLTNLITAKVEARGQYITNENQWTPVALVGFEFNTSQFGKPFSR